MAKLLAEQQGELIVDKKRTKDDRFDDLTYKSLGHVVSRQFKHSTSFSREFEEADLRQDRISLRLDTLVATHEALKSSRNHVDEYRICLTYKSPSDLSHYPWLKRKITASSFVSTNSNSTFSVDLDNLWPEGTDAPWLCLQNTSRLALRNFTEIFVIELDCPASTFSIENPGPLEKLLINLLQDKVGFGIYPNESVNVNQVSSTLIRRATSARGESERISVRDLEIALSLRTDFGRVAQTLPVDHSKKVTRSALLKSLEDDSIKFPRLILEGQPGAGKSWILDDLERRLKSRKHIVAKHYCFLEPGDSGVSMRVTSKAMFASLLYELIEAEPSLRHETINKYSANFENLQAILPAAVAKSKSGHIFLIIDGLDHITRVLNSSGSLSADEVDIVSQLSRLQLPTGAHLVLGSQPGLELVNQDSNAFRQIVPEWNIEEINLLTKKFLSDSFQRDAQQNLTRISSLIAKTSSGNPLLAAYLCRDIELRSSEGEIVNIEEYFSKQWENVSELNSYYHHLTKELDSGQLTVARLLASLDFSVTNFELLEIVPFPGLVESAMQMLRPLLKEVAGQGGIHLYHESYRDYLLRSLSKQQLIDVIKPTLAWLEAKSFFTDARAFRFLFPLLQRSDRGATIIQITSPTFVADALKEFQPRESIEANLLLASLVAADNCDLPLLVRLAQLRTMANSVFEEKIDFIKYGLAFAHLKGGSELSKRLLFDGRAVFDRNTGLKLCSIAANFGGVPPWQEYLQIRDISVAQDGRGNDIEGTYLDELEASLQTSSKRSGALSKIIYILNSAESVDKSLLELIKRVKEVAGLAGLQELRKGIVRPGPGRNLVLVFIAEAHKENGDQELASDIADLVESDEPAFVALALRAGSKVQMRQLSIKPSEIDLGLSETKGSLKSNNIAKWVHVISAAAYLDQEVLLFEVSRIIRKTRFEEWLRFVISLSQAEALFSRDRSAAIAMAEDSIFALATETDVFFGHPRGCDLYSIHNLYRRTIERAFRIASLGSKVTQILDALLRLVRGTTTSLENSQSGPCPPEFLFELLLPYAISSKDQEEIASFLIDFVEAEESRRRFFEELASYRFGLAEVFAARTDFVKSSEQWKRGCDFLIGYGFRKDVLLLEPIDSLVSLSGVDLQFARMGAAKLQPLIYSAMAHTDGSETKHLFNWWFKVMLRLDPVSANLLLARAISQDDGIIFWQLENAIEDAIGLTPGSADVRSYLSSARAPDSESKDLEVRMQLIRDLALVDIDKARFHLTRLSTECLGDKVNPSLESLDRLIALANELSLIIPFDIKNHFQERVSPEPTPRDLPNGFSITNIESDASPSEVSRWLKNISPSGPHYLENVNLIAAELSTHLIRIAKQYSPEASLKLVRAFVEKINFFFDSSGFEIIGNAFEEAGFSEAACISFCLAFVYARGSGGYARLGDKKNSHWFGRAYRIDKNMALQTLCNEVVRLSGDYAYGITKHLTELSVEFMDPEVAKRCWEEGFECLRHRLPTLYVAGEGSSFPRYLPGQLDGSVDEALFDLLASRLEYPVCKQKLSALAGIFFCTRQRTDLVIHAYARILDSNCLDSTKLFILSVIRASEDESATLSKRLKTVLTRLLNYGHYGIQQLSYQLLSMAGEEVSSPLGKPSPVLRRDLKQTRINVILDGDQSGALTKLALLLGPEIISASAERFDATWEGDLEKQKERNKRRFELVQSRNAKYPVTPICWWPNEVLTSAIQAEAVSFLAQFPVYPSDTITKKKILEILTPNVEFASKWWASRVIRPTVAAPSEIHSAFPRLIEDVSSEVKGWRRVGFYEEELEITDGLNHKVVSTRKVAAGLVSEQCDVPKDVLPFFGADAAEWFQSYDEPILIEQYLRSVTDMCLIQDELGSRRALRIYPVVAARIGLRYSNENRISMVNKTGEIVSIFRRWSAEPANEAIDMQYPKYIGLELIVRPDIFEKIEDMFGGLKVVSAFWAEPFES